MSDARSIAAKAAPNLRAKTSNDPRWLRGHSGCTPAGRRRRDLVDAFITALGGIESLTEVQLMGVRKAAELTVIAEQARARALTTDGDTPIDLTGIVRAEGAADRAVRALGIKSSPAAPKVPTIAEWLAERTSRAAEAPAENAGEA